MISNNRGRTGPSSGQMASRDDATRAVSNAKKVQFGQIVQDRIVCLGDRPP